MAIRTACEIFQLNSLFWKQFCEFNCTALFLLRMWLHIFMITIISSPLEAETLLNTQFLPRNLRLPAADSTFV